MRKASILLVEDDVLNRRVIARILRAQGHEVAEAASAEDACASLRQRSYDAILSDIGLPGITGLQAIAQFTKLSKACVILITGRADREIERDALSLGAKGFFSKPLDFARLSAQIQDIVLKRA